jgi:nicotinate-nucleotide adenylyltransferase
MKTSAYAVLGGTFDPIHYGHLKLALYYSKLLQIDKVHLMPCYAPVHKDKPAIAVADRLNLLQLAITSDSEFSAHLQIDEREIIRNRPSYTIDTLNQLRSELSSETPVYFIMGLDSFANLESWHSWQELLSLTNILVSYRTDASYQLSPQLTSYLAQYQTDNIDQIKQASHGCIFLDSQLEINISSSLIRNCLHNNTPLGSLVPNPVADYINHNNLYK